MRRNAFGSGGVDGRVGGGELGETLAAATAARRHSVAVGDREDLDDRALACGDHRPDRRRLGADALGNETFSTLLPAKMRPDAVRTAAPTGKCEYGA